MRPVRLLAAALLASGSLFAGRTETAENAWFSIAVDPLGARLVSVRSKAVDMDFAVPGSSGLFTESSWDRWKSRGALARVPFVTRTRSEDGTITVTALGQTPEGGIPFLKVAKRYVSTPDSTALGIVYRFINAPDAMSLQAYAPSVHLSLAMKDRVETFVYPTADGIVGRCQTTGSSITCENPSRGWYAAVDPKEGVGAALTFPFEETDGFRAWLPGVPATEIRFVPVGIENGAAHEIRLELIPFRGLRTVSGAGGGLVGSLADGTVRVVSSRAGRFAAVWDGGEKALSFAKPGDLQEFRAAGDAVRILKDGREVCRLEAKPASGKWRMEPLVARRKPFKCEVDLTSFTNFPSFGGRPWAKPLAGGPVRVSIVSGQGNQLEIGMLAEHLDMDYRTIGVIGSQSGEKRSLNHPQYGYGDFFGRVSPADLEREVNRVLSADSEAIVLGGVTLDALPESSLKIIRERVASGSGLVLIGNDERAKVDFAGGRVVRLAYPAAPRVGAWLMYGLTPDLRDFYPDREPEYELYHSRVARAILEASGRVPSLAIRSAAVGADAAALEVDAAKAGERTFDWIVCNSFRETIARGRERRRLAKGAATVRVPLGKVPAFAGPLSFEVSVRGERGVEAWGEYGFTNAPAAEIVSLDPKGGFVKEGDELEVKAVLGGRTDGQVLRLALIDVHDRLLDERRVPAAAEVKVVFRLVNGLRSRSYRVVAELQDGGRTVSRRRTRLTARPAAEKLVWDDYEIGTCGNSETRYFLFPWLAKAYKDAMIVSAGGQWPVTETLAPYYDFNTGISTYAGIMRESEPPEYAKTGDKTKLVRRNCISSPAFFENRRKAFERYRDRLPKIGYRHHGFGDEQSITGYEGAAIDFCFSPDCLREFRAFAKGRYGTLGRLNAEYESEFGSWDEVMPFTRQEVWQAKGRHVAGWADHLEFMDDRVTNALAFCGGMLREMDPDMRLTLSGTQPPAAYSGMDWSKIMHVLDGMESYRIGGQFDLHRSFRPDGRFTPWSAGYALRGDAARKSLWDSAFHGSAGVTFFWARSQFRPDFTPTHGVTDILPDLTRLAHGVGKYLLSCTAFRSDTAVLYSQASFRAAFIEERRAEHDRLQQECRDVLRNLGVAFDYLAYDRLADGGASAYKALVLVDAVAMSDREVAAVKDFAAKGGTVIALGLPATRAFNCRPRKESPFAGWFGGPHKVLVEPTDAPGDRSALRTALTAAGVCVDPLKISAKDVGAIEDALVFTRRDAAGNPCFGVVTSDFMVRKAVFRFPRKGWVRDLVDGRDYGVADEVSAVLSKGHPHAFVQLPSPAAVKVRVTGNAVSAVCEPAADTVLRVEVFRPDGTEATCYALNALAKGGKAEFAIPFALSDPKGEWKVEVSNVFGDRAAAVIRH